MIDLTITAARAWVVDIEPLTRREDAVQAFVRQETIFVELTSAAELSGVGYSYTIGTGGRSVLAMLEQDLLPLVVGLDAGRPEHVWRTLFGATRSTTVGAVTSLSLAAIDLAVWDLRTLASGQPLWRAIGGAQDRVPLYDTEGGWIHLPPDQLAANAVGARSRGLRGVKLKVGRTRAIDDLVAIREVRQAVGDGFSIMVDGNQSMTYPEARQRARQWESLNLTWFEEPLSADDVDGHMRLAASTTIPVAVGESMYSVGQFRQYVESGAAGILQPDVARVGGVTPWLKIAHLAEACNLHVAPHFLMEIHVSLACAVPNATWLEYIPQLRPLTSHDLAVDDGCAIAPQVPGLGIAWTAESGASPDRPL